MRVLFQNHSSLLIEHRGRYLLTDPWFEQPAFGSWLPSLAPYVHPTYIASLANKLTVLVSHGHDDHLDDKLLRTFPKETKIVTAQFKSPSVRNRLNKIGFTDIEEVNETGDLISDTFSISSYIVEEFSHDDAIYLITTGEGAVIHANDNWHPFDDTHAKIIRQKLHEYGRESVLLFSQTNSASGYPLTYRNLKEEEQISLLRRKVAKMVEAGLQNAETLGLSRMFSYAGFAVPYVKGKKYNERGIFPTAGNLRRILDEEGVMSPVIIEELYPGDWVELPSGKINKAFVHGYEDNAITETTSGFYSEYGKINQCMSYSLTGVESYLSIDLLDKFLTEFNNFVCERIQNIDQHFESIIGKTLCFIISSGDEQYIYRSLTFGQQIGAENKSANKTCYVEAKVLNQVLEGNSLFEDLYTGYNAEWSRQPEDRYNRDIVMMIVMFSYVYKNRISKKILSKPKSSFTIRESA